MAAAEPPRIYCIDSSSLIAMKRVYPRRSLGALWELVEQLAEAGRLIAPHEVFREIGKVEDDLKAWAKKRSGIFVPIDTRLQIAAIDSRAGEGASGGGGWGLARRASSATMICLARCPVTPSKSPTSR